MTKYTEQFKLAVVEQYLTGAAGFKTVAHQLDLDHSMVGRWVNGYRAHGLDGLKKKYSHYYNHDRIKMETKRAESCAIQNPALGSLAINRPTKWGQFKSAVFVFAADQHRRSGNFMNARACHGLQEYSMLTFKLVSRHGPCDCAQGDGCLAWNDKGECAG